MARPVKARRICGIPGRMRFGPLEAGTGPETDQMISLSLIHIQMCIRDSVYEELFELNLAENTYKILFHQNGKYVIPAMEGRLDTMCMEVAAVSYTHLDVYKRQE